MPSPIANPAGTSSGAHSGTPTLTELASSLRLENAQPVLSALAERGIHSLSDILVAGGLSHIDGLPVPADDPTVRVLDAHANLSVLSSDGQLRGTLIEKGYTSLSTIARISQAVFVATMKEGLGEVKAVRVHEVARAQTSFLKTVWAGMMADRANGFPLPHPLPGPGPGPGIPTPGCGCKECESAVSPLAYLTDLVAYVLEHLKNARAPDAPLTLDILTDAFHQPFRDLPLSCDVLKTELHQARICIEVLRSYLDTIQLTPDQRAALVKAEAAYRLAAYQVLLNRIGTSYEEIRLARTWDRDPTNERDRKRLEELTERLGVDSVQPGADLLDRLLLLPEPVPPPYEPLTEQNLEKVFGLADTTRDLLSAGATLGDDAHQIVRWTLKGVDWSRNTDPNGYIYVSLKRIFDTGGGRWLYTAELFRDPARTDLVTAGSRATPAGAVELIPENASALSGTVDLAYTSASDRIVLSALPNITSWRLGHLRAGWTKEDWPADPYRDGLLPVIDPDLIGPDDFRLPDAQGHAFALWMARRSQVDQILQGLRGAGTLEAVLLQVLGTPLPDLDGWLADLTHGINHKQTVERITSVNLTVESFVRLMAIQAKDREAARDQRIAKITDGEWREVYSILTQVQKEKAFSSWRAEEASTLVFSWDDVPGNDTPKILEFLAERFRLTWVRAGQAARSNDAITISPGGRPGPPSQPLPSVFIRLDAAKSGADVTIQDAEGQVKTNRRFFVARTESGNLNLYTRGVSLGPEQFWISLREPQEGDFPPDPSGQPLIDPDLVRLLDLPEPGVGNPATTLWHKRRGELAAINQQLRAAREGGGVGGFDAMLKLALGDPLPADPAAVLNELKSSDPGIIEAAKTKIQGIFHMAVDAFVRLMAVRAKDIQADPLKKPTESEYIDVYTMLTDPAKILTAYPRWIAEEQSQGFVYWLALKARLPRWRASAEARHAWQQALRTRSQSPNLDPDLVTLGDLKTPTAGPASELWTVRADWLQAHHKDLKDRREKAVTPEAGLDAILQLSVGLAAVDLTMLDEAREKGQDIRGRLDQLSLTPEAFSFLSRMARLAASPGAVVLESEWSGVYNILVQVQKRLTFARWREEERAQNVALGPDHFRIVKTTRAQFPPPAPVPLVAWRASQDARREWLDTLQARVDQEQAVLDSPQEAVGATEEAVLPLLRDALVMASDADGPDLASKSRWLSERLLIDTTNNGCQKTTRIAQAIETLQALVLSTRTVESPSPIFFSARPAALKRRWTHIVPGEFGGARQWDLLCYDKDSGDLEIYSPSLGGDMVPLNRSPGWKPGWTHIVPGFLRGTRLFDVLFYNSATKSGELYSVSGPGQLSLQRPLSWNPSWSRLAAGHFAAGQTGIVCFSRDDALLEFDTIDTRGFNQPLNQPIRLPSPWTDLVAGRFGGTGYTDLFLFDEISGTGEFDTTDGQGNITLLNRTASTSGVVGIVAAAFTRGVYTDLLFCDLNTSAAEFFSTDGRGDLSPLKQVAWPKQWTVIVPNVLDPSAVRSRTPADLLLYDHATRTGQLPAQLELTLDAPKFDEEWKRIGAYDAWRAAMLVFLCPENLLLPSLRPRQTPAFQQLVEDLRSRPNLTPNHARSAAKAYSDYFRDVCALQLEACADWYPQSLAYDSYFFGRSPYSGKAYWSTAIAYRDNTIAEQTFWEEIPGLPSPVIDLVGAVAYGPRRDGEALDTNPRSRFVYIFVRTNDNGQQKLAFNRYDVDNTVWDQAATSLELPDGATSFTAQLKATADYEPPQVGLDLPNAVRYVRSLNAEGTNWEQRDFRHIFVTGWWDHLGKARLQDDLDFACSTTEGWPAKFAVVGDFDRDHVDEIAVAPWVGEPLTVDPNVNSPWVRESNDSRGNDFWVMKWDSNTQDWVHLKDAHGGWADFDCGGDNPAAKFAVVGDFDGDGTKEIAIAPEATGSAGNDFWVMKYEPKTQTWGHLKDARGGWADFDASPVGAAAKAAVAGDFDGDGRMEIAILAEPNAGVSHAFWVMRYNPPSQTWEHLTDPLAPSGYDLDCGSPRSEQANARTLVTGDFDGDGKAEIALALSISGSGGNDFYVLKYDPLNGTWGHLGREDGSTGADFDCGFEGEPSAMFAVAGDFDGDGNCEIAVAKAAGNNEFWVMKYDPDAGWSHLADFRCSGDEVTALTATVGDFDGDGQDEIAVAPFFDNPSTSDPPKPRYDTNANNLWVMDYDLVATRWRHIRGLRPSAWGDLDCSRSSNAPVRNLVCGDFDHDGRAEIAASPEIFDLRPNNTYELLFNGGGNNFWVMDFNVLSKGWLGPCVVSYMIAPDYRGPFDISDKLNDLTARHDRIKTAFELNKSASATNLTYLEEAWYFVPMQIALQLQQGHQYAAALDWFRSVFDYQVNQKIYRGLELEESIETSYARGENWLTDPGNPHAIAEQRTNAYTRFTVMSIVRCLLEFADAEFTRDTAESVSRARTLYSKALELLDVPMLRQDLDGCDTDIHGLDGGARVQLNREAPEWLPVWNAMLGDLAVLHDPRPAIRSIRTMLIGAGSWRERFGEIEGVLEKEKAEDSGSGTLGEVLTRLVTALPERESLLLARPEIARATEGIASLVLTLSARGRSSVGTQLPTLTDDFCIVPNAVLTALRLHGELNLWKLRNCQNIAGMVRQLEPYSVPVNGGGRVSTVGAGGRLALPDAITLQPTPYRYAVLIERAKQLAGLAQQMEAAFLSVLDRRDAEAYTLIKARQDVRLSRAGLQLQQRRSDEAQDGLKLTRLQQERAQVQVDQYQRWLDEGISDLEYAALGSMILSAGVATGAAAIAANPSAVMGSVAGGTASAAGTYASYERRRQQWEFERTLAQQDVRIGGQQVTIAEDHVRVAAQERTIAVIQADHAEATLDFLSNKFTNVELFDWMSGVLERVYRFFVAHATAMAKLAENQLVFERHEIVAPVIQADYWDAPADTSVGGPTNETTPDRRGLTGSARLLQDIYQLDQAAFDSRQRKLQLTKTFSLARLAPFDFQRLRETGVITLATPMASFDQDFPGQYLRLIRRVRTSVFALVPPSHGIRATLSTRGVSRIVIGGDVFQTVVLSRPPESVALSSPRDATGLFELDQQSDLLLPFEGMGVDTVWELRLPRAANLFDYNTIADIQITIEYTALDSVDYRRQVIQSLGTSASGDRPFSFRQQFADAWYDLHNPDQVDEPRRMVVDFNINREDFPPNLDDLRIRQVVLYFSRVHERVFEIPVTHLHFVEQGTGATVGGAATSIDGIVSTRRANGSSWTPMIGKAPVGTWELALPNTDEIRGRFKNEEIEDILFVVTYSAETPPWPA